MIRSGFASGRTCNKVTLWEMIGSHLGRGLFCLLHWKGHLFSWFPPSVLPPARFWHHCRGFSKSFFSASQSSSLPFLPPVLSLYSSFPSSGPASFPLNVSHFSLCLRWHQKGQSKPGSQNTHKRRSRDVAESCRSHLLSFLCTREGICVCIRVLVCVCVSLVESTCFTLRKSCYKFGLLTSHTTCLRNVLKTYFCRLTASWGTWQPRTQN